MPKLRTEIKFVIAIIIIVIGYFLSVRIFHNQYKGEITSVIIEITVFDKPANFSRTVCIKDTAIIDKLRKIKDESSTSSSGRPINSEIICDVMYFNGQVKVECYTVYINFTGFHKVANYTCDNSSTNLGLFDNYDLGEFLLDYFEQNEILSAKYIPGKE